jgi:hypothetical protein
MHAAVKFDFVRLYGVHVHNEFKTSRNDKIAPPAFDIATTVCLLLFALPLGPCRNPLGR